MQWSKTAWLMVGQPKAKKRERRARWNAALAEGASVDQMLNLFLDEVDEDRL